MARTVTEQVWNGNGTDETTFSMNQAYGQLLAWCTNCDIVVRKGDGYDIGDYCPACGDGYLKAYEHRQDR